MHTVEPVVSLDQPELAPFRTMRLQHDHWVQRIFVAEGEKVVRRLLESNLTVLTALLPGKWLADFEPILHARSESIRVFTAEKEAIESLTGFSMYQGVLATARIPDNPTLESLLAELPKPRLLAAVDGLTSAENLGALVRSCAALGVQGILVSETSSSPYLRRAVRSSMGAVFRIPILHCASLASDLQALRAKGILTVAAHPHDDRTLLPDVNLTEDCCVVFGSEGYGISLPVRESCDVCAAIPMANGVDSLNVASASAAFLYEAWRQRRRTPTTSDPLVPPPPNPPIP